MSGTPLQARLRAGGGPVGVVILGRFVSTIGYYLVIPFLTIHLLDVGFSGFETGVLFAILNFTRRGLGVPAGWASDRWGAGPVLASGLFIEVIAYLGFAFAGSFLNWAVAVALLGTGGSLNNNGARTLLARGGAAGAAVNFSRYYVMINAAALIGPLAGALLLAQDRIWIAFMTAAILHLIFAAVTTVMVRGLAAPAREPSQARVTSAIRDRDLMMYCLSTVGCWFLITQLYVALPLTIAHQKVSSALLGPLNALNAIIVMAAVLLLGARIARRTPQQRLNVLSASGAVMAVGWLACAVGGLAAIVVAVVVVSLGESLFCAVVDVTAASLAPPGRSGIYLGYATMSWAVGGTLGSLAAGLFEVAADHDALSPYWIALSLAGVASAVGVRLIRQRLAEAIVSRQAYSESDAVPA